MATISFESDNLLRRHPEHDEFAPLHDYWREAYQGCDGYLDGENLIRHPREKDNIYAYRQAMSVYHNYAKEASDLWISKLFGPGMSISLDGPDAEMASEIRSQVERLENDFDLIGTGMQDFFRDIVEEACSVGTAGVFTQVRKDGDVSNLDLAERAAQSGKLRPYCTLVAPENIRNWGWDRYGQLDWVLLAEPQDEPKSFKDDDATTRPVLSTEQMNDRWTRFFYIDRETITVYEPDPDYGGTWKPQAPIKHGIKDGLPFQTVYWGRAKRRKMFARSPLEEIYKTQDLIYNLQSASTELMTNQMFSILVLPKGQGDGIKKKGEDENELIVGSSRALSAQGGLGFSPHFISPEADIVRVQMEKVREYKAEIRRIARMGPNSLVDDGKVRDASGRSKAFDSDALTSYLRKTGDSLENALKRVLTTYIMRSTLLQKLKNNTPLVRFPDSFLLRGIREESEEAMAVCAALPESPTACRVVKRQLAVSGLRSSATQEEIDQMKKEISEAEIVPPQPMLGQQIDQKLRVDHPSGQTEGSADGQAKQGEGTRAVGEQPGPTIRRT